eukprot:gb/GEZN01004015.1/.p1 GENE.gb/GEZN01004015.1/~~gb/GEZN01004015.1/.p1  ORF type:complete len:625 (-),score=84.71 gb/GEZN01004015.1/:174-2021(-)
MPVVNVFSDSLFKKLGKSFTEAEFQDLCFEFGIELDDVTSEKEMVQREKGQDAAKGLSERVVYKIDIPANRYDLLSLEGIARSLKIFMGKADLPTFQVLKPKELITLTRFAETGGIRPYVVAAVLRGISFDQDMYDSFIDLQEKLHFNLGRRRTLIAIGTHDLDSLKPPFTYEARPKDKIKFQPLMETEEFTVDRLFKYYKDEKANAHVKQYLPLTEDHPVHPVIYDSNGVVLSLPPIINGEHSKISLKTRNIFIECTGTDLTKLETTLNMLVASFSEYCAKPFTVEAVRVVDKETGQEKLYPQLNDTFFETTVDKLNRGIGINVSGEEMVKFLGRMSMPAEIDGKGGNLLKVKVPPTRPDILHPVDIMEDVAIAYGYNKIVKTVPTLPTVGKPFPLNHYSDLMRETVASAGFLEVLTWALVSHDEAFKHLQREDPGNFAVRLASPKTVEFEITRPSLLGSILKVFRGNKKAPLPIKIFEVGDVVFQSADTETGTKNNRRLAAGVCSTTTGFEIVHGLLDHVMLKNQVEFGGEYETWASENKQPTPATTNYYTLAPSKDPAFFQNRAADIFLNHEKIGVMGTIHPSVLKNFDIPFLCSAMEIDLEKLSGLKLTSL